MKEASGISILLVVYFTSVCMLLSWIEIGVLFNDGRRWLYYGMARTSVWVSPQSLYSLFVSYRTRFSQVFFYMIELGNKNIRLSDVTL